MRRHPLAGRETRPAGTRHLGLLGLLVAGSLAACVGTMDGSVAGAAVTIATAPGETLAFEPRQTTMTADGPLTITFANRSRLSHNLVFTSGLVASTRTIVAPGTSDRIVIAGIDPGTYQFACTIHDGMAGTLVVVAG